MTPFALKSTTTASAVFLRLSLLALLLLAGCGGGGEVAAPAIQKLPRALIHASDSVSKDTGYDIHMQPLAERDPALSVLAQSRLPGNVMLWAGDARGAHFERFGEWLNEAKRYPNITHVYVYDELFWSSQGINVGHDEAEVIRAAHQASSAGLKPVVVILPDVVLDPSFRLAEINAFAVIGINVYPSARPQGTSTGACRFNDNAYSNLFYCSLQKLRAQGFTGEVWYVYQAFGVNTIPLPMLTEALTLQRDTIRDAAKLGAAGLAPWGLHLSNAQIAAEPFLFQLSGTALESLVTP